jgi:hypothetical protein
MLAASALTLLVSSAAPVAAAPAALDGAALVGTIACEPCQEPFQAIGVVRLPNGHLVDLRLGDALPLPGFQLTAVKIGDGFILFRDGGRFFKLTNGGFPEEQAADEFAGHMLAGSHGTVPGF